MNEFIVWDKDKKCFYDGKNNGINVFQLNQDGTLSFYQHYDDGYFSDEYFSDEYTNNFYIPFKNTELKDINGKSIYADSSIVEFEFYNSSNKWEKTIGYFKYIPECFCYVVIALCNSYSSIPISTLANRNIEIIDTIQENKLGLIK